MKKIIIILSALIFTTFLFASTSYAGSWNGWIYQNPYPTKNTLLGVKFVTPQKGWVVGEHGTILYTEDGGENWEAQESGTEEDLKSVAFVNEKVGWAVGNRGVIIHTEDGGKKWERQGESKTNSSIFELLGVKKQRKQRRDNHIVFFLNKNEGWVGGSSGTFLHTTDGGKNWNKENIGSYADVAGIFFSNSNTGWVLSGGRVYRTKDRGRTWASSELPTVWFPEPRGYVRPSDHSWEGNLFFINEKKGWATTGFDYIFHTEDGGKIWKATKVQNSVDRIAFTDEKNGCMAAGSILCTEDGGKTWNDRVSAKQGRDASIENYSIAIWGLSFANRNIGFAVGKDGQIFKTEDGGKKWKANSRKGYWHSYFFDSKIGWYFRHDHELNNGSIVKTEDGGNTWKTQKAFESRVDGRFFFVNPATGWAVGEKLGYGHSGDKLLSLFILNTNDGGKTWVTQFEEMAGEKRGIEDMLFDVFFINQDIGWVAGPKGLILHTKDGGKHWLPQKTDTKLHITKIRFIDVKNGIAICDTRISVEDYANTIPKAVILYTDDGGQSWHKKWEKKIANLDELFFLDNNNVWIIGEIPNTVLLLYSNNGGKTWSENKIGDMSLDSACFVDKDRGALFTKEGGMLITTDGGKHMEKKRKFIRREPFRCEDIFK